MVCECGHLGTPSAGAQIWTESPLSTGTGTGPVPAPAPVGKPGSSAKHVRHADRPPREPCVSRHSRTLSTDTETHSTSEQTSSRSLIEPTRTDSNKPNITANDRSRARGTRRLHPPASHMRARAHACSRCSALHRLLPYARTPYQISTTEKRPLQYPLPILRRRKPGAPRGLYFWAPGMTCW